MNKVLRPQEDPSPKPLLIVRGDHDLPVVQRLAEEWHAKAPNSRFERLPNAGHCANLDNTEQLNQILLEFMGKFC